MSNHKCKVLAIGDPHFKVDNMEESQHFYHQVERWLLHHPVDFIVILGDILHSHEKIYTFALNMAVKFIKMCSNFAETYCIVGNHDATSNTIYCSDNHWLHVFHSVESKNRIHVVDKPVVVDFDEELKDSLFVCCPYVSDGRFMEMLDEFVHADVYENSKVIFAHQLFNGGKMGAIVAENVEEWNKNLPLVISGHLHDRHTPQPNLHYAGSSQQLAFSESGDKSICVVSIDRYAPKPVMYEDVFLDLKERKTVHTTVAQVPEIKLRPNVQYKIVIKDEPTVIAAFKKTAKYKQLLAIENVRSVQFKSIEVENKMQVETQGNDFLSQLQERLKEENPYIQSYANHLLTNSEDLSDKDILLV